MFFVVVREIEGLRTEQAVFADLAEATECFEEASYAVRNAPGEDSGDDPTIVTAAWLYAADTADRDAALKMASGGHAVLLEKE